jgi:hypothetical protein
MEQLPLPQGVLELVAAFRGVRPTRDFLREMEYAGGPEFLQDRRLDMQWETDGDVWQYRWCGTSREMRAGRPVHAMHRETARTSADHSRATVGSCESGASRL